MYGLSLQQFIAVSTNMRKALVQQKAASTFLPLARKKVTAEESQHIGCVAPLLWGPVHVDLLTLCVSLNVFFYRRHIQLMWSGYVYHTWTTFLSGVLIPIMRCAVTLTSLWWLIVSLWCSALHLCLLFSGPSLCKSHLVLSLHLSFPIPSLKQKPSAHSPPARALVRQL